MTALPPAGLTEAEAEVQRAIAELKHRVHTEDLKIASYIESNPEQSISEAKAFVSRFLGSQRHARYHWILRRWDKLLNTKSALEIAAIFRTENEATEELRSSAPFCGAALETY